MKKFLVAFLCLVFIVANSIAQTKSRGVPACPYPFQVSQPDGSQITLVAKGDGVVHWFETNDGYSVLKTKDGWFQYASLNEEGDMVCSGVAVNSGKLGLSSLKSGQTSFNKHLRFSSKQIKKKKLNYFGSESTLKSAIKRAFPSSGVRKVLLILAEFSDLAHQKTKDDFNNLMNQENYNGTGSFRDYYMEVSYDKLNVTTTTTVWVKVPNDYAYYGKNDDDDDDTNAQEFIRHAVDAAEEAGVDFSEYDNDGDEFVDAVQVIHAGYGEEAGADDNTIWSHAWALNTLKVQYDGVWINRYVTFPELSGNSGTNITNIGVICHEFGHGLGLPDYYDTSDDGDYAGDAAGLGNWDMMAGGSWNNNGQTPAHHNAYSKYLLGWLDLKSFSNNENISIKNLAENADAYYISSKTENEYFILENRQKIGFDSYIPHHGMLIYHVDRNFTGWNDNNVNSDPDHEGMDLLEADNNDVYNVYADPFPGTGQNTTFSDITNPGSVSWAGEDSEIEIKNILESNSIISFDFAFKLAILYAVKFVITDNGFPVEGVELTINGKKVLSDSNGEIIISDMSKGEYPYTVNKYGFYSQEKTLIVGGDNPSIEVPLNFISLGIADVERTLKMYPNPTSGMLYVEGDFPQDALIKIISLKGETMVQKKVKDINGYIDLSSFLPGIYNVLIVEGKNRVIRRIVIK